MKKLLFILTTILILQGGFPVFAKLENNIANLLVLDKKESTVWVNEQEIDSTQNQKINTENVADPDLTFNVGLPVFEKRTSNGVHQYYYYCRNDPTDLSEVQLQIYPKNSDPQYSYSIDWGDGTPQTTGNYTPGTPFVHNYLNSVRNATDIFWQITYTITHLGIPYSANYNFYVGSSPVLNFQTPNNIALCVNENFVFPLNNVSNSADTKYTITFNDGSQPQVFNPGEPLPQRITHSFTRTSCNVNSIIGGTPKPNSFSMTITAENKCGTTPFSFAGIYVSEGPQVNLPNVPINACVNQNFSVGGTVIPGSSPNSNSLILGICNQQGASYWEIRDAGGHIITSNTNIVQLTSGNFGNSYGLPPSNFFLWNNATQIITVKFLIPGIYTATLVSGNQCGSNSDDQTIFVNPSVIPVITVNTPTNISCNLLNFNLSNGTNGNDLNIQESNLIAQGLSPVQNFKWEISKDGTIIQTISQTYSNGLFSPGSISGNYITSGNYVVKLTYLGNTCNPNFAIESYPVPGNAIVSIMNMDACLDASGQVNITAQVDPGNFNTFNQQITDYTWEIKDTVNNNIIYSPVQSNLVNNYNVGSYTFTLNQVGGYKATLTITTSCGSFNFIKNFVVAPMPVINHVNNIVTCEGKTENVTFTANAATTGRVVVINGITTLQKFYWENDNPGIGLPVSGYGDINFTAINNSQFPNIGSVFANIIVFPLNNGCQGEPISFTITVNPSKDTAPHKKYVYCNGDPLTDLKVKYNDVEANTNATYQWYSFRKGENGVLIPNKTSASLTPLNIVDTTFYYCEIKGCGGAVIKSNPDTVIIQPAAIITDYNRFCKSGIPADFTPINGIDGSIPQGTTFTWKIDIANSDPRVIGASDDTIPNNFIRDTLSLPVGFNLPFAMVRYIVKAKTGECEEIFKIDVKVIPNITADIKISQIKCFGSSGSIDVSNIVGIIGNKTQIELWKNQVKETEIIITDTKYNFSGLPKGNYKIIILDKENYFEGSEFVMDNLILNEPEQISISSNLTNVTCFSAKNGLISVTVTGGTLKTGGVYSYKWEKNTGSVWQIFTDFIDWKSINGLAKGLYRLTVTDENNCWVQKEFLITEPNPLNFDHVSFSIEDCDGVLNPSGKIVLSNPRGGTVVYTSNYQFKYRQNNVETNYMNLTEINSKLSNIQEGKYYITLKDDNNCEFTKEITINRISSLVAFINSDIAYDCGNTISRKYTVTVAGGVPDYSVKWFAGNNEIGSGLTFTPPVEYNGINITVKITDQRNCIYTLVLDAFKADVPIFDWYYKKKTGCNEYEFIAQISDVIGSNYEFIWDFGSGEEKTKSMSITRNLDGYPVNSITGDFEVNLKILRFGCEYPVKTKIIHQNSVPNIELIQNGASEVNDVYWFCKGDTITVTASGATSYSWSTNSKSNSIRIYDEGIYTVWGLNGIGCISKRTFETKFYNQPFEIIADPPEIELGESIIFSVEPTIPFTQEYKWNFGDGTTDSSAESFIEHLYKTFTQDYFNVQVKIITDKGCVEEASTTVKVNIENIPNTIIPEGSIEANRIFMPGCRVQIFNRNGVLIHQGENGWDGKYHNKLVASDTYFYVLTYSSKGKLQTRQGYITVLR